MFAKKHQSFLTTSIVRCPRAVLRLSSKPGLDPLPSLPSSNLLSLAHQDIQATFPSILVSYVLLVPGDLDSYCRRPSKHPDTCWQDPGALPLALHKDCVADRTSVGV